MKYQRKAYIAERVTLVSIIFILIGIAAQSLAQDYISSFNDQDEKFRNTVELSKAANIAATRAVTYTTKDNFTRLQYSTMAMCERIFCSCSAPKDSDDCKKIKGCADDFLCIKDKCYCTGGHVE